MPKVTVDGVEIEVPQGATVLQACELDSTLIRFRIAEALWKLGATFNNSRSTP